ncbi:MAG: 4Fe-4S dicluster domain-containing protein [Coriobacteriales bacterium]|jgi:ferredoxin-type protein NapG|nr:4Fe-4S dicluster domain-containing protein [Coriobacteriales bacterium]
MSESNARQPLISRRQLALGGAGAAVVLALGGAARALAGPVDPLRPPGAVDEASFIGACIRCNRCRGACPRGAIVNCDLEDGIINARTPKLSFHTKKSDSYRRPEGSQAADVKAEPYAALLASGGSGYCDFCNLCIENCPSGALRPFDPASQWIGEAVIDTTQCIAFAKLGGCRRCVDYCPFNAITLDASRRPVVDPAMCNGCGVCENICPSSTYRTFKGSSSRGINVVARQEARPL